MFIGRPWARGTVHGFFYCVGATIRGASYMAPLIIFYLRRRVSTDGATIRA